MVARLLYDQRRERVSRLRYITMSHYMLYIYKHCRIAFKSIDVVNVFVDTFVDTINLESSPSKARVGASWMHLLPLCLPIVLMPLPSLAFITLRAEQVGPDVVITGSGTANLSGLTFDSLDNSWTNAITDNQIYAGPAAFGDGSVSLYSLITGPSVFGIDPGLYEVPDNGGSSGDLFGILASNVSGVTQLVLPSGYVSNSPLSGVSIFSSLTIAQLGLTPGQLTTWSWGSGLDSDGLRLEVADSTSVPAPAPLLGLGAVFHMARRLRRRLREKDRWV